MYDLPEPQSALGRRTMETFTVLLAGSAANAAVFRESGGSQRVQEMLGHPDCTQQALGEKEGEFYMGQVPWRSSVASAGVKGVGRGACGEDVIYFCLLTCQISSWLMKG